MANSVTSSSYSWQQLVATLLICSYNLIVTHKAFIAQSIVFKSLVICFLDIWVRQTVIEGFGETLFGPSHPFWRDPISYLTVFCQHKKSISEFKSQDRSRLTELLCSSACHCFTRGTLETSPDAWTSVNNCSARASRGIWRTFIQKSSCLISTHSALAR